MIIKETVNDTSEFISHNLILRKDMTGIFLCNETQKELPIIDYYQESNTISMDVLTVCRVSSDTTMISLIRQ